jgi:tetratricopeptide (TPR) repeat protein
MKKREKAWKVSVYQGVHNRRAEAQCIYNLGKVARHQSRYMQATERYEKAHAFYEEVSDKQGKAQYIYELGALALEPSKYDEARSRFKEALRFLNDRADKTGCIYNLGMSLLLSQKGLGVRGF